MNLQDFIELTGEHPEDILGADWENICDEMTEDKAERDMED